MLPRGNIRALAAAFVAAGAALLSAAPASAATTSISNSVLYYTAANGEVNNLSITFGGGQYTLRDSGTSTLTVPTGCNPGPHEVHCPLGLFNAISVDLGDQNDIENSSTLLVTPVTVHGGPGNDSITIGAANDYLDGGPGNDTLDGGFGDDTLDGGMGADVLKGNGGFDTVTYADRVSPITASIDGQPNDGEGGEGDNVQMDVEAIVGGSAGDTLTGSNADNTLVGDGGNDTISGLVGNDTLDGGAGQDRFDGGAGADKLKAADGDADAVACGSEVDSVEADTADAVAPDCENVSRSASSSSATPGASAPGAGAGAAAPPGTILQAPAITIATSQAVLTASGSIAIKLACPKDVFEGCNGTIALEIDLGGSSAKKLSMARRRKLVKLAPRRHFKIAAGRSQTVVVHMSRRGKRFFAKHPRAKVNVTVAIKNATGVTTTTRRITVKRRSYARAPGAKGRHR